MKKYKLVYSSKPWNLINHTVDDIKIKVDCINAEVYLNNEKLPQYKTINYYQVHIERKFYYVHRLIAQAIIPNPKNLKYVIHLDGNLKNNHVENLAWSDGSGLRSDKAPSLSNDARGASKIPKESIPTIIDKIESGIPMTEIAKQYNVSSMSIQRIKNRYLLKKISV